MRLQFDFARNLMAIEGDGPELMSLLQLVRDIAPKLSEIKIVTGASAGNGPLPSEKENHKDLGGDRESRVNGVPTMREFARSVGPANLSERIVAIAAYVERYQGKASFTPKEMGEWFTICGFQKPSQMAVALFDAKRKNGYLDKAGHGFWKLSTSGENVVTRKLEEVTRSG